MRLRAGLVAQRAVISAVVASVLFPGCNKTPTVDEICLTGDIAAATAFAKSQAITDRIALGDEPITHIWCLPIHRAAFLVSPRVLTAFCDSGADPDATDHRGRTALTYVVESDRSTREKREEAMRLLLLAGADVSIADTSGNTPLHYAARYGRTEMVKLLLDAGANVNTQNSRGNTPLHECADSSLEVAVDTAKSLIGHGAPLSLRNADGKTALEVCSENPRCEDCIDVLTPD